MLRVLRYSPSATTSIAQSQHNHVINITQIGAGWLIDFSVADAHHGKYMSKV